MSSPWMSSCNDHINLLPRPRIVSLNCLCHEFMQSRPALFFCSNLGGRPLPLACGVFVINLLLESFGKLFDVQPSHQFGSAVVAPPPVVIVKLVRWVRDGFGRLQVQRDSGQLGFRDLSAERPQECRFRSGSRLVLRLPSNSPRSFHCGAAKAVMEGPRVTSKLGKR